MSWAVGVRHTSRTAPRSRTVQPSLPRLTMSSDKSASLSPRWSQESTWDAARYLATRLMVVVGALLCGSCERSPDSTGDPTRLFAAVHLSPALAGVSLPMTVEQLADVRKNAVITEFGLSETIGGASVSFHADRGETSDSVSTSAMVRTIEVAWMLPTNDSAAAVWARFATDVAKALASDAQCFHSDSPQRRFRLARWSVGAANAYVQQRYADSVPTMSEWHAMPPRISIGYLLDSTQLRPLIDEAAKGACSPGR